MAHSGWRRGSHCVKGRQLCGGGGLCHCGGGVVERYGVPFVVVEAVCNIGTVSELLVGFWWSVKISWIMDVLDQDDGAVVGASLRFPSGAASECTLPALAATPLQ